MSTAKPSRQVSVAAIALAILTAACAPDAVTSPGASTGSSPKLAISVSRVFTVQLRARPGDPYYGYGNLQVYLGNSCRPGDPYSPAPGFTALSLCGKIFNGGGALYTGGGIYWTGGGLGDVFDVLVTPFSGALPPNPCHRYDVAGLVVVPDAVAADMLTNTTSYAVRFDGQVGSSTTRIGGRLDGTAWGSVSRPGDPYQPSDPFFAENVCSVAITP